MLDYSLVPRAVRILNYTVPRRVFGRGSRALVRFCGAVRIKNGRKSDENTDDSPFSSLLLSRVRGIGASVTAPRTAKLMQSLLDISMIKERHVIAIRRRARHTANGNYGITLGQFSHRRFRTTHTVSHTHAHTDLKQIIFIIISPVTLSRAKLR